MTDELETALEVARVRQRVVADLEAQEGPASTDRDAALYDAQQAGASYADLQEATGLSSARLTQVLRRERERRATPPA